MNAMSLKLSLVAIALGPLSTGCKESPIKFFGGKTQKLSARKIVVQKQETAERPQLKEVEKSPQVVKKPLTSTANVSEYSSQPGQANRQSEVQPTSSDQTAPVKFNQKFCFELIKNFPNEPYFYNFQATIKKYHSDKLAGHFILSHVRHHNIKNANGNVPDKMANLEPYNTCASIILSYHRYQNVQKLRRKNDFESALEFAYRAQQNKSNATKYPYNSCLAVIAQIDSQEGLSGLKDDMARANDFSHPEEVMAALLQAGENETNKDSSEKITAQGCIMALRSVNSLDELKQLRSADNSGLQSKFKKYAVPTQSAH